MAGDRNDFSLYKKKISVRVFPLKSKNRTYRPTYIPAKCFGRTSYLTSMTPKYLTSITDINTTITEDLQSRKPVLSLASHLPTDRVRWVQSAAHSSQLSWLEGIGEACRNI